MFTHLDAEMKASPFNKPVNDSEKKVIEQNNFTNQNLITIDKQLDKIDEIRPSSSKKLEKPLIQLPEDRTKLGITEKDSIQIQKIEKLIHKMEAKTEPSQVTVINQTSDS